VAERKAAQVVEIEAVIMQLDESQSLIADTMNAMRTGDWFNLCSAIVAAAVTLSLTGAHAIGAPDSDVVDRDQRLFQRPTPSITRVRDLQPVEQQVEDVDPLAHSMRRIERGLQQPFGFEQVYRVPSDDELYMRIDGGLYGVFPRSVYLNTKEGDMPLIPANTVFWIGTPSFLLLGEQREVRSEAAEEVRREFALTPDLLAISPRIAASAYLTESLRIDDRMSEMRRQPMRRPPPDRQSRRRFDPLRLPLPLLAEVDDRDEHVADAEPSIDERFRQRIHHLLRRAAHAEAGGD
jgi:hypothetical protein